jgi:hypothetical protein
VAIIVSESENCCEELNKKGGKRYFSEFQQVELPAAFY